MKYHGAFTMKDGRTCVVRNGVGADGQGALDCFFRTHAQTDWLLSTPEEIHMTVEEEARFLEEKARGDREIELVADVAGRIVGTAGFQPVGGHGKVKHRAVFGISVDREYWGLGIGRALTEACVRCAKAAGYAQLELEVVAENKRAIALYQGAGFVDYGLNPRGFQNRNGEWQPLAMMRLELVR